MLVTRLSWRVLPACVSLAASPELQFPSPDYHRQVRSAGVSAARGIVHTPPSLVPEHFHPPERELLAVKQSFPILPARSPGTHRLTACFMEMESHNP